MFKKTQYEIFVTWCFTMDMVSSNIQVDWCLNDGTKGHRVCQENIV